MVSDRDGLSYYSQDKMSSLLELSLDEFVEARNGLIRKSLIAFNGLMFQLLSLPVKPIENLTLVREDYRCNDRLSIRQFLNKTPGEVQKFKTRRKIFFNWWIWPCRNKNPWWAVICSTWARKYYTSMAKKQGKFNCYCCSWIINKPNNAFLFKEKEYRRDD